MCATRPNPPPVHSLHNRTDQHRPPEHHPCAQNAPSLAAPAPTTAPTAAPLSPKSKTAAWSTSTPIPITPLPRVGSAPRCAPISTASMPPTACRTPCAVPVRKGRGAGSASLWTMPSAKSPNGGPASSISTARPPFCPIPSAGPWEWSKTSSRRIVSGTASAQPDWSARSAMPPPPPPHAKPPSAANPGMDPREILESDLILDPGSQPLQHLATLRANPAGGPAQGRLCGRHRPAPHALRARCGSGCAPQSVDRCRARAWVINPHPPS